MPESEPNHPSQPDHQPQEGGNEVSHGELLERLTKTSAPVPPMLAEAVGYTGASRFVAIHWGGGDEAYDEAY